MRKFDDAEFDNIHSESHLRYFHHSVKKNIATETKKESRVNFEFKGKCVFFNATGLLQNTVAYISILDDQDIPLQNFGVIPGCGHEANCDLAGRQVDIYIDGYCIYSNRRLNKESFETNVLISQIEIKESLYDFSISSL